MRVRTAVLLTALVGIAAACSPIRAQQGYRGDDSLVAEIKPGVDNRESVAKLMGRPSIQGQWDDRQWYYVSRKTRQYAFRTPRPEEQTIWIVSFDPKGNVAKVDKRGLEQVASISPNDNATKTVGKDRSFWEDVFGNIGSVGSVGQGPSGNDNTGGNPN